MKREHQMAILRNFPAEADLVRVYLAIRAVITRTPAQQSEDALRKLIADLAPIYKRHANEPITLAFNCPFVALVAAAAEVCGWGAGSQTIRDIEMRMRPAKLGDRFGRRAIRAAS